MLERILKFSIQHRFLVLMLTLAAGAIGLFAAFRLPIDAVPDITNNQVVINVRMPALSPYEVEKRITTPIEQELSGIPGLQYTRSHSWNGMAQISAVFEDDVDVHLARQQISERLIEVRDRLPAGADPKMGGLTTGLGDIYMYTVEYEHPDGKGAMVKADQPGWQADGTYLTPEGEKLSNDFERAMYLRTVQDWVIRPKIKAVKDVADIEIQGGYVKQYQVAPDPKKLVAYGLTFKDINDALEKNHSSAGAGYIEQKGESYIVRFSGQVEAIDDIAGIAVTTHNGTPVRISDVATVGLGKELRYGAATSNGKETVMGIVQMLVGANSRTVSTAIEKRMDEVRESLPADIKVRTVLSRTKLVESTIKTVLRNLAEGAVLVVVVLFLLLGNFRAALITALAIPLSMLLTAVGMVQAKISGNLMSLGAIDFGLIVDGAVIIVENCLRMLAARQHELGRRLNQEERLEVVFQASKQVRSATAFGESIIIIVYLPILALLGVAGKMYRPMALTVIVALVSAFVLSLTFIPAMVAIMVRGKVSEKENPLIRVSRVVYEPILRFALRWRLGVVAVAVAILGASIWAGSELGSDFIPKLDEGDLLAFAHRAPSVSLTQAIRIQTGLEDAIKGLPEVEVVTSRMGTGDIASDAIPMGDADTFIILKPRELWPDPHKAKDDLKKEISARLNTIPGTTYELVQPIEDRFNDLLSGIRLDVGVRILGDDFEKTMPAAQKTFEILRQLNGESVSEPKGLEGLPVLQIVPDRAAISRLGMTVSDLQDYVTTAIGGRQAGVIFEGDRNFDLIVRLPETSRKNTGVISELPVPLPKADAMDLLKRTPVSAARMGYLPLSALAKLDVSEGPNDIEHENGTRGVTVTCNLPPGQGTTSFVNQLKKQIDEKVKPLLPRGNYSVEIGGQYQTIVDTWQRLGVVIPLGLFLVFVLLFTTFNSIKHAVIVFSGVPLALSGGLVALWLRDINMSISAGVGFIALSGVAVLNGLVMITFINQLRREGIPLEAAITKGSLTRLRPVLMTALVASLGFVPMAIATGPGAEVQKPLATVVIGGIISSTFLTLVVLPALYRMFHRKDHVGVSK